MAAAFDDEDLSVSLSSYHQDHSSRTRDQPPSDTMSSTNPTPMAMPPPPRPNTLNPSGSRSSASVQSPATRRDMQRLDQYKTVKVLGEGSFGKVKLAIHQPSGRQVALKIIPRRKLLSRDMVGRVEREIQYLQLLRHPHIIKLYTVIPTKADIVMVLEYAERELFDYLVKRGKCNDDEARKFFQQIICAVEYCHRHKIVHRDLKPENLLIDSEKNVKIADFGLSNIMTDGNFLKTSCGSPNYAAPEVISGKLYAGPEVDVWSCGVILYVLLVGRLPFDDDYIPALFKKIAAGNFHMPSYISPGAARLIRAMLQVHPVHRISIPDIRQDPWFLQDLPAYLQPPPEEFIATGADPNKAVDRRKIAPGKSDSFQEKIHESAVNKLEHTMGYKKEEIEDALRKSEPSAVKDAFFIIAENELMQTNSPREGSLTGASPPPASPPQEQPAVQTPQAPTTPGATMRPEHPITPLTPQAQEGTKLAAPPPVQVTPTWPPTPQNEGDEELRVSHVRILPTSLPYVHEQIMEQRSGERRQAKREGSDDAPPEADMESNYHPVERTPEQQAATARALKPHSRSLVDLGKLRLVPPDKFQAAPAPPKRSRKWQFGIRSRNQPYEAMLCLYKAIAAIGGVWEIQPAEPEGDAAPYEQDPSQPKPLQRKYSNLPSDYYIPKEAWFIRARLLKDGVTAPGVSLSAHSSRSDLGDLRRKVNLMNANISAEDKAAIAAAVQASSEGATGSGPSSLDHMHSMRISYGVWVFIDIQLYQLENNYMVDFKCDGYQNVIRADVDGEWRPVSKRFRNKEKEVTSPYPYLDVASDLVAQLAIVS